MKASEANVKQAVELLKVLIRTFNSSTACFTFASLTFIQFLLSGTKVQQPQGIYQTKEYDFFNKKRLRNE
jgi:hypothetical protein